MDEVYVFTPRKELDAASNLKDFVHLCREKLTVFGENLDFESDIWDVTETSAVRGKGDARVRVSFNTQKTGSVDHPMGATFRNFAKAYVRYSMGINPSKALAFRVASLRALDLALAGTGVDVSPIFADAGIFNRAAQLIREHFKPATAYRIGGQLQMVADFMDTHCLTIVHLRWISPLKRPNDSIKVGKEYDDERSDKLPSQAALDALPKAYRMAIKPSDVIVTSIAAILCSAPDRISEVLTLPENCEIENISGNDVDAYGLRWWAAKGGGPMSKWIVPSMSSVVREALSKIRGFTNHARKLAAWYENNPRKIYLDPDFEFLRNQEFLSPSDVNIILWGGKAAKGAAVAWCLSNKVSGKKVNNVQSYLLSDVEKVVLEMLPSTFPICDVRTGMKFSEALFVVQTNLFHSERAIFVCMFCAVTMGTVSQGLGNGVKHGKSSVFTALDLAGPDGEVLCIRSHQFRHYLNTLAQAGGLSQLDIAKWSGRKDIAQNAAYDHVPVSEILTQIRALIELDEPEQGSLAAIPKNVLIRRDEFARLKIPTAHTTVYGYCVHDYTMAPCQMHRDCINCEEQICVKGDAVRKAALVRELDTARNLLDDAKKATASGYMGADRWMDHHSRTVERLQQLTDILYDPSVPDGSVIMLSNLQMPSPIMHANELRLAAEGKNGSKKVANSPRISIDEADQDLLRGLMFDD